MKIGGNKWILIYIVSMMKVISIVDIEVATVIAIVVYRPSCATGISVIIHIQVSSDANCCIAPDYVVVNIGRVSALPHVNIKPSGVTCSGVVAQGIVGEV